MSEAEKELLSSLAREAEDIKERTSRYERHYRIHLLRDSAKLNAKQISRELKLSVKTVRRHLKKPLYYMSPKRVVPRKLDPHKAKIKALLEKHEYSAAQIFQLVKEDGYTGSESVIRDYVAQVRPCRQTAYLTLHFEPGQTAQVDFAECGTICIGESRRKLYAFIMTLCHSRMLFVKFILRQNTEHFLQCHREAFEYFKGVPSEMMVDNCKVAVTGFISFGSPVLNQRYAECAAHYGFKAKPCAPFSPESKGRVERSVSYLRSSFLNGLERNGLTLSALNHGVRQWMENVANKRVHSVMRKTPLELFTEEQRAMQALPLFPYDCGVLVNARASSQYRVVFESNKYSVPHEYAGKRVELSVYPERLIIRFGGKNIAEYERCYEHNRDCALPEHDAALLEQRLKAKIGVVTRQFLALGKISELFYQGLQEKRFNTSLHIRKIMLLLNLHGKEKILSAMEEAVAAKAFSSDYIISIIEIRGRACAPAGPLHLSRKSDYLDLEIESPDMGLYDIN